jgi:tricorn protease
MSQASLDEFERDLCAAAQGKDGLLVDVRNNGGGSTADRVLASLMSPVHAYTVPRGADRSYTNGYPQDRLFIQRWTLPANMLCNEKSFSNAEIVSHAFKNFKARIFGGRANLRRSDFYWQRFAHGWDNHSHTVSRLVHA